MLSYGGTHLTQDHGALNIRDIAVQSMRMVRFAGAGRIFWPIGMHSLLVADILFDLLSAPELEHHGYLHDSEEPAGLGDTCRPFKTDQARALGKKVRSRIYAQIGIPDPTQVEEVLIHEADMLAVNAEGELGCGPRGYAQTQSGFKRNKLASGLLRNYLDGFDYRQCIEPDGKWPLEFERRLRSAIRAVQSRTSHRHSQQAHRIRSKNVKKKYIINIPIIPEGALPGVFIGGLKNVKVTISSDGVDLSDPAKRAEYLNAAQVAIQVAIPPAPDAS